MFLLKRREFGVATDKLVVDENLGHCHQARALFESDHFIGFVLQIDLFK